MTFIGLFTLAASSSLLAIDKTWAPTNNGNGTIKWSNSGTWTNGTPTSSDTAFIGNNTHGADITYDAAAAAPAGLVFRRTDGTTTVVTISSGLTFSAGTTLFASGSTTITGAGTFATNNLHVASGATFTRTNTGGGLAISGILSGNGTIAGAINVSGTHSVGDTFAYGAVNSNNFGRTGGIGSQTVNGTLTYNAGSIFAWDLSTATSDPGSGASNQGSYDQLSATTLAGAVGTQTFQILLSGSTFANAFWDTNKTWSNIVSAGGSTLQGIFDTFGGGSVAANGTVVGQGQFSFAGNNLVWTAIPETSTALAGLLVAAGLLQRRRSTAPLALIS